MYCVMQCARIPLSGKYGKGKFALVDTQDLVKVAGVKWHVCNGYAMRTAYCNGKRVTLRMHHVILPRKDGLVNDHKNGNRLDNRRCNLRRVTVAENNRNRVHKKDYYWDSRLCRYRVQIDGRQYGSYESEAEAIAHRDMYRRSPERYRGMTPKALPRGITREQGKFAVRRYVDGRTQYYGRFLTLESALAVLKSPETDGSLAQAA